ncbi:MAG: PQQ-binding-like beta-propeller repeat protein, partial [Vicinamibacterales bacterium]
MLSAGLASAQSSPRAGVDWPGFRGIAARGVDDAAKALPEKFSVPDKTALKWRVPVAGLGHSSPIVWGDQVCTASAISGTPDPQLKVGLYGDIGSVLDQTPHKFIVSCFDKKTGKQRWERIAKTGVPVIKRHPKSTHASSTLATDGRHIVAMFGSEGLYAYDMNGKLLWQKEFGTLDSG